MPTSANMHKLSLGLVIIIAMVAALLPACMAIACGTQMTGMPGSTGLGFTSQCAGTMTSGALAAISPGSPQTFILTLVAALGVVLVLVSPPLAMRPLRAVAEDPPPPPEDPRGVRLII